MTDSRPRAGDTIIDPSNGRNLILDAQNGKLLLQDQNGFRFVLARHRLSRGWKHTPREQRKPARVPYLPRERKAA